MEESERTAVMNDGNTGKPAHAAADRLTVVLFYAGLLIELAAVILDKSSYTNPYESLMFRISFLMFSIRFVYCLKRFDRRELAAAAAALAVGIACWHWSGRNDLIRFAVFLCACRTVNIRKAAETSFLVTLGGCLAIVLLSISGIMGHLYQTYDYGHGLETRWDLGFGHPNSLHCMVSMLIILGLYLYEKQMKMYLYLLLFILELLMFYLTRSNGGFLLGASALIISLAMRYSQKVRCGNALYRTGEIALAGGIVFTVIVAILKPSEHRWLARIDDILTGRLLTLWKTTFHEGTLSTWHWFGSRLNTFYFDLGWLRLVYWYGVIPAVLILILTFAILEAVRKRHDGAAFMMLICCAVYTVFEAHLVSVYIGRNYLLFIAAQYLPVLLGVKEQPARTQQ